jgi:serine/threonine protein kinase
MKEQHGHTMEKENKIHFGNYDLVRRIDVGGMGEVYLAKQRSAFDREVAIKIIRRDLVNDSTARQRFLREAEVSAHLKHNHVLPMYELGEEQGRLFLVTPYIAGGTLARRLQNGPLPLPEVHQLFSALLDAVAYIHKQGVVHRDLKPNNILLDEGNDGRVYVRLIDFGIARVQGAAASPPLTTADNEMGTIAYMAPERLSGVAAPSNDIYSLGVILYQMLTGYLPIDDQGRSRRIPLPQTLDDVVDRCIAPRIDERFHSAEEVLAAFDRAVGATLAVDLGTATRKLFGTGVINHAPTDAGNGAISLKSSAVGSPTPVTAPFSLADYNAPTTAVDASQIGSMLPPTTMPIGRPPRPTGRRKSIWFPIMLFLAAAVLLAMSGVFAFELLAIPTAIVHFKPQTQLVSKVFQLSPNSSVPIKTLNGSSTGTQSGQTSQFCDFFNNCQRTVSDVDVISLEKQVYTKLQSQAAQDVQQRLQALNATELGAVHYSYDTPVINPQIGTASNTVMVTLTQHWDVAYFLNSDAQTLARQLLVKQMQMLGANFMPVNSTLRVGQPVVGEDGFGDTIISIAAAGYVEYQFPQSQLNSLQNQIKGKTVHNARIIISLQPGVDPNTISILFRAGGSNKIPNPTDTLPTDAQRITLVTDPLTLPPVQLPNVPAGNSPTTTLPPVATPPDSGNPGFGNQDGGGSPHLPRP